MTETALDKVLRLSVTRAYTRMEGGRLQQVGPYNTRRRHLGGLTSWGALKPGQRIVMGGVAYEVMEVNAALSKTETAWQHAGKAAAARKIKAQGQSLAQKTALKKAASASAKTKASGGTAAVAKAAAKKVHVKLKNLTTGRVSVRSLAAGTTIQLL